MEGESPDGPRQIAANTEPPLDREPRRRSLRLRSETAIGVQAGTRLDWVVLRRPPELHEPPR
jgi:hypothetical protein